MSTANDVMVTAKDIMIQEVVIVPENMGVRELARLLCERMITGAPVVDEQGYLVGVVSAMDIVRYFSNETKELVGDLHVRPDFYLREWDDLVGCEELKKFHVEEYCESAWVSEIMTPVVFEVNRETPLTEIAAMMVRGRIHRVIVTESRRVIGIISSLDVMRVMAEATSK